MIQKTLISYLHEFPARGKKACILYKTPFRTFSTSYEDLFRLSHQIAAYFENLGLKKGDRVILWGVNSPEWVAAFLGCLLRGIIAIPMDLRGSPAFVEKIFRFTEASLAICNLSRKSELGALHCISFEALKKESEARNIGEGTQEPIEPSDIAEILFTSGTTAEPKGVVLSHENIFSNVEALHNSIQDLDENEKWLSLLPLSHIFEQTIGLWFPLKKGYSITYLKVLKASSIFQVLEEDEITVAPIVPRLLKLIQGGILREVKRQGKDKIFGFLLDFAALIPPPLRRFLFPALKRKFGKLKYFVVGGATLERDLEDFWERLGVDLLQGYGLTETSPVISCNLPKAKRLGSIGRVLPGISVELSPEKEIWVRGPTVFSGYYRNPEKTREAFEGEWFKTGDLGEFDRDRFLYFRGRKKDLIVTPEGLNVYPDDIEALLQTIPGVKESCVVGIKKEDRELIHAVLLLEDPSSDAKALVDQANTRLADYQKIQSFSVWAGEDFPRTSTMKVKKNEVLRILEDEKVSAPEIVGEEKKTPRLYQLIAQLAKLRPEEISSASHLGDNLGLSSLDRVELASVIEEEFHFDVDDTFLRSDTSIQEIEEMIKMKTGATEEPGIPRWPVHPWARRVRESIQDLILFPVIRFFCRLTVEGKEELRDLPGPVIFVANHTSYFDAPVILLSLPKEIRRRVAIATWKEFFESESKKRLHGLWKQFEFYFASLGFNIYLFPREKGFKKSIEHTGWLMDRGFHIFFFPEGIRTRTGTIGTFQAGIGMLVSSMNVPVVPVGLKGLFEVFPPQRNTPHRGGVTCRFGRPMTFSGETHFEIAQKLQAEVERLMR